MRHSQSSTQWETPQFTYELSKGVLKTFATPGIPFLTFAHFVDIVQWYRDVHFAPDHVPGFEKDIGVNYQVWTRSATSTYERHIFPDELSGPITIGFSIPCLPSPAWIPLAVTMFDEQGLYFRHEQKLVMERLVGNRMILTSWRKIPTVRKFLEDCTK